MQIRVLGMDPSLSNWGMASGMLNITSGVLSDVVLTLMSPEEIKSKQVRQNSKDLHRSEQLAQSAMEHARRAKIVFVECPVGSQSARAMASYGICVGILGALRAEGIQLIEVTPAEVKTALTGSKDATKAQMIAEATRLYPSANWCMHRNLYAQKNEHLADAIATIHAGVRTPAFKNLMRLLKAAQEP